jgi:hypothetical protein
MTINSLGRQNQSKCICNNESFQNNKSARKYGQISKMLENTHSLLSVVCKKHFTDQSSCGGGNENLAPTDSYSYAWSPVGGTVWEGSGGVAIGWGVSPWGWGQSLSFKAHHSLPSACMFQICTLIQMCAFSCSCLLCLRCTIMGSSPLEL